MSPGKFVLLILAIFCALTINAQTLKSFSEDQSKFPAEVELLFSKVTSPSSGIKIREVIKPLTENWLANLYSDEEKALVISNANLLLSKKTPVFPDIFNYFSVIYNLKDKGNQEALTNWMQDFGNRIPGATQRKLRAYLEQYKFLVSDMTLYESSTFSWFISDTSFRMEFDTAISVYYQKSDLTCATRKDTSRILQTIGVFYPNTQEWIGKMGKVTWQRVGLSPDSVFAELRDYHISMKLSEYTADSVKLVNMRYFREPLFGELIEKVLASPPGPTSSYPRFVSYLKNYEIHNLFKDIDYRGGFTVEGARVIGSGEVNSNASLYISREGQLRAHIRSNAFRILGDQITANPAALSILTDGDSIYHPGLQMRYVDGKRQLEMYRYESGISESPFFNGFHEIDMDCGALVWNLDSDSIDFESVPGINTISINSFISDNFFSKYEFYKIQGIDDKNPLYIIRDYSKKYDTDEITPDALASFMNKPVEQVKAMMLKLSIQGFLYYDVVNDRAVIQDRLKRYISANVGNTDYDVIRINSETNKISNATLDLTNYNLLIRGVKEVFLSDSQQVYIYPEKDEIILKKGMDFVFSGNVSAGLFDFYAHDCSFEYDSFKLNIPLIDSLSFKVKSFEKDDKGNTRLVRVASVIENLSGKLQIDNPSNKSGLQSLEQYPIFYSEKESFVYYDHDPLYQRDSFAYHIYPFVLDNLDNFSTDNLFFKGYLVSAGIFPDIGQPLKVQPDYSLGFINPAPAEGYPVYSGIGQFYNEVNLSNRGLRGKGQLKFLTSQTVSRDFHFYPETMITSVADDFTIAPQIAKVEYPAVAADSIYQDWFPYRDTMHLKTIGKPIRMYEEKSVLNGDLYYSSTGLSGNGKVGFESVELASEKYIFKHHTIDADTLDFKLFAKGTSDLAVSAQKYRTHVDFETRNVQFRTNEKGSAVSFPYNNFLCFMDNIDWYMDQHEMKLYNTLGEEYANIGNMSRKELLKLDLSGSDFVATNPAADSLSFFSVTARYDIDNYIIEAEDVKLVRVADAAIFPDSNYVKISKGGQIQTLKNAGIIADTASQYHTIEKAEVNILSRINFQAKGQYQYVDTSNVLQEVPLSNVSVDSAGRTIAKGVITEKLKFSLNSHFLFKGNMSLASTRKELYFEGGFKTTDDCFAEGQKYWVYFKSWVNPDDVRIPVEPPLADIDGNPVELALQISDYEDEIYPSWFTPKVLPGDTAMVSPSGEIFFDEKSNGYRVATPGIAPKDQFRPQFLFDTRNCSMLASGPLSLGLEFNYVGMTNFGDIRYMVIPDSATFNVTLTFDFLFYDGCLSIMADSLNKADLKGLDITRGDYLAYLDYNLGSESKDLKEDINNYGKIRRMPDKLIHKIVLSDVNLYWNSFTNSYISRGPIGVMSLGRDAVNRYVTGYLELIRRRSGDVLTLYLEIDPTHYYFFDYRNGIMQSISSDNEYNNRINETKQEKRVMSIPGLDETYEFLLSTPRKRVDFLRRMEPLTN